MSNDEKKIIENMPYISAESGILAAD